MDEESQPNSFSQEVTTGNGVVKTVVAQNQQELDEAVKALEAEHTEPAPDITDPADGNKIVSPDNKAVEDIPSEVNNDVEVSQDEEPEEDSTSDEEVKPARSSRRKK